MGKGLSEDATEATPVTRFCPFCGLTNPPEHSFCARCGKPLPSIASTPVGPSGFVPPPPEDLVDPGDGPVERPLTETERSALKASPRVRSGNAARAFGTLLGVAPLTLVLMSVAGVPVDSSSFLPLIMVAGFLAMFLGVGASKLLTPIRVALASGQVSEVRGVPEKRPDPSGKVAVTLGDLDLLVKPSLADRLPEGQLAALSFVVVGMEANPRSTRAQAIVLGVNGQAGTPEDASLAVSPDVAQSLRAAARPRARGRKIA